MVTEDYLGYPMQRLIPRRAPDLSTFDAEELATIDSVLADLANLTAETSFGTCPTENAVGFSASEGETIPYHMALRRQSTGHHPYRDAFWPGRRAERHGIALPS